MAGVDTRITIDAHYLQPGDIIRSVVGEDLQVTVERPSLRPAGHLCRHPVSQGSMPREHLCNCSLGRDHRTEDNREENRGAQREARRSEREDGKWMRQV